MNNNTTRIIVIIMACLLFLCVALSPHFIEILASKKFKEKNYILPAETKNIVYSIDGLDVHNLQYLHFLGIYGWAFIDGKSADKSRISLVLTTDNNTYIFSSNENKRYDVAAAFKTFSVINSGFLVMVPWKILEDGQYKIGLLIRDDDVEAFQYTDRIISKQGNAIFYSNASERYEYPLPNETENIVYAIDSANVSGEGANKIFTITGWGYIKGESAPESAIYIVLRSQNKTYVYGSAIQKRPDVSDYFKTLNFDDSGFHAEIPMELIDKGTYRIGIYIRKGNKEALLYTDKILNKSFFGAAFR
jgi:hypothetical protein